MPRGRHAARTSQTPCSFASMSMRAFVFVLLLSVSPVATAATPVTADVTDLWWSPTSSGRGVNVVQQSNALFVTFFVYGADGKAHWYVASDMRTGGGPSDVELNFTGPLYETTGPSFSDAFNP